MTLFRIVNIVLWGGVLAYMATGAWAVTTKRGVRWGDPMRLACFVTAALIIGYHLVGLAARPT